MRALPLGRGAAVCFVILTLLVSGASAVFQSIPRSPSDSPPGPGPMGTSWFGDTTEADFGQGTTDGVDTRGRNDHVVPRDDFNGSQLDTTKWRTFVDSRAKAEHLKANGTLRASISSPGTTENSSFFSFRGAFEADFDFTLSEESGRTDFATVEKTEFRVYTEEFCFGPMGFFGVAVEKSLEPSGFGFRGIDNGKPGPFHLPADANTTIRFNRSGPTIRGYFWNATGWQEVLRNDSAPSSPLHLCFGVSQQGDPWPGPFSAEFDDFRASGRIVDSPDKDPAFDYSFQDGVRMLPLSDNFDASLTNADRWSMASFGDNPSPQQSDGKLRILELLPGQSGGSNLTHRKPMRGDFDIRLDYAIGTGSTGSNWSVGLAVTTGAEDYEVRRNYSTEVGHTFAAVLNGSPGPSIQTSPTNLNGSFRISRTGDDIVLHAASIPLSGPTTVTLQWTAVAGATSYGLEFTGESRSFANPNGAGSDASSIDIDNFFVKAVTGTSPVIYGDATLDSRVFDTQENDPGKPDWQNLYFNASGTNYFVDPSTRGLWYFEEPSGLVARDESPNGQNGNLINGVGRVTGRVGEGVSLDGANQYVESPDSVPLSITGPFTLESWFNTTGIGLNQAIVGKYQAPFQNGYSLTLLGTGRLECATMASGPLGAVQSATTVSAGAWHHAACVYDGASIKVYLDGVLDGTVATTVNPVDGSTALRIGAPGAGPSSRFSGKLDEVRVSARALTAQEAWEDFSARKYVRFQLATSDSPSGPWVFRGRDGTGNTWYSLTGQPVPSMLDGDRYFRYRAEINSSASLSSPALHDVGVTAEGPSIPESGALPLATVFVIATVSILGRPRRRPKKDS